MTIEVREEEAKITYKLTEININDIFNINFQYGDDDENIRVSLRFQDGTSKILVLDTDYRVETSDGTNGIFGTIVILKEYFELLNLCIYRDVPLSQETKFDSQTVFADTTEQALDKLTMICQDNMFENRTIRAPKDEILPDEALLMASATERANKFLCCDQQGYLTFVESVEQASNSLRQGAGEPANPTFELSLINRRGKILAFSDNDAGDVELLDKKSLETEIVDNLNDTSTDKALSANMGKTLNDTKQDKIEESQYFKLEKNKIEPKFSEIPYIEQSDIKSNFTCSCVIDNVYYAGTDSQLAYTTDFKEWKYKSMPSQGKNGVWCVFNKGNRLFALEGTTLAYSDNLGDTWITSSIESIADLSNPICVWSETEHIFVATSLYVENTKPIYSEDGLSWYQCTNNIFDGCFHLEEYNGIWIGITGEFTLYKCSGSIKTGEWILNDNLMGAALTTDDNGFVILGATAEEGDTLNIYTSSNGIDFVLIHPFDDFRILGPCLIHKNNVYILSALQHSIISYSTDLINWNSIGNYAETDDQMAMPLAVQYINNVLGIPYGKYPLKFNIESKCYITNISDKCFGLSPIIASGNYSDLSKKLNFNGENIHYDKANETVTVDQYNDYYVTIEPINGIDDILNGEYVTDIFCEYKDMCYWKLSDNRLLRYNKNSRGFDTLDINNVDDDVVSIGLNDDYIFLLCEKSLYKFDSYSKSWIKVDTFNPTYEFEGSQNTSIIWTGEVWCISVPGHTIYTSNDGINFNSIHIESIDIQNHWNHTYVVNNRVIITSTNGDRLLYSDNLSCNHFNIIYGEFPTKISTSPNCYWKALYDYGYRLMYSKDGYNYIRKDLFANVRNLTFYKNIYFTCYHYGLIYYSTDLSFSHHKEIDDYKASTNKGVFFFVIHKGGNISDDELLFSDDKSLYKIKVNNIFIPYLTNDECIVTDDSYIVPTVATTEKPGVVQPDGKTITIDNGVITAVGGSSYTLPIASSKTLGGVKVGLGLMITEDGTLSIKGAEPAGKIFTDGSISDGNWIGIAYGNGMFVAISNDGKTAWSTDGKTFSDGSISISTWHGIGYGDGMFIGVSDGETAWSTDGKTFSDGSISDGNWYSIAYGDGMFVAVGNGIGTGSKTAWSTDGKNFTDGSISDGNWKSIAYGNGMFVAVGSYGKKTAWSTDGKSFTDGSISDGNWYSIAYGDGMFVAIGILGTAWSTDGKNFTIGYIPGTNPGVWISIAYGDGMFVAVSTGSKTAWSTDGKNFTDGSISDGSWKSIAYGDGMFVAVGSYGKQTAWSVWSTTGIKVGTGLSITGDTLSIDINALKTLLN